MMLDWQTISRMYQEICVFECLSITVEPNDAPYFIYHYGWKIQLINLYAVKLRIATPLY